VPDREALVRHALRQGRDLTESHHKNCADMACFREWARDCPRARAAAASVVYLPTYPGYGRDEIEKTIAAVRGYFRDLA
jgi:dTDP-4-amino-4,6-dideoxygalactose transaminase